MMVALKTEERNRSFQKLPELQSLRQQREDSAIQLRKQKRIEHSSKRRAILYTGLEPSSSLTFPPSLLPLLQSSYPSLPPSLSPTHRLHFLMNTIKHPASQDSLLSSLACLKQVLSKNKDFPFTTIFDLPTIEVFSAILVQQDSDNLRSEALWVLIDAFHESSEVAARCVQKGIVELLCSVIHSTQHRDLLENSIWCLGNLLGEIAEVRNKAINSGVWRDLLITTTGKDLALKRIAYWVLSNLCKSKTLPLFIAQEISQAVPQGLVSDDKEIASESAWIAYYLSAYYQEFLNFLVDFQLIPVLLSHLHSHSVKIQYPVLKIVGNISGGSDRLCEEIASQDFINTISPLLTHPIALIKKEVLFIFSNFLAGSAKLTMMVLESPCIQTIVGFMSSSKFELKKEAVWGICNAASSNDVRAVARVMELNVIQELVKCLVHHDANLLKTVVGALKNIFQVSFRVFDSQQWHGFVNHFEEVGGFCAVYKLCEHSNVELQREAEFIIQNYSREGTGSLTGDNHIYSFT